MPRKSRHGESSGCKSGAQLVQLALRALDAADPQGGIEYLRKMAKQHPSAFMSLIGKIIPRHVQASVDVTFDQRIEQIRRALGVAELNAMVEEAAGEGDEE